MKYRKKPIAIEAKQWFTFGDHPAVRNYVPVIRSVCHHCKIDLNDHGYIDTLEGGHIVCPSDWIITGVRGENYPIKDSIFRETYEPVTE